MKYGILLSLALFVASDPLFLSGRNRLVMLAAAHRLMRGRLDGASPLHRVYRRVGRACSRCGAAIRSYPQGEAARMAYWCPGCQKGGRQPSA